MIDEYKTITRTIGKGFYSEKRSKFLAFAHHVETINEIKELLAAYHKKYYDSRHVCYAYVLGENKTEFRSNDDGEPSSTAGKPILGQIHSRDLTNVLVVVIRYYGGINLGTAGLITAYRTAASDALDNTTKISMFVEDIISFSFSYPMMNSVMRIVKEMRPKILSQTFDNTCSITLSIRKELAPILRKRLDDLAF